jgi:hypothetical protein
MIPNSLGDLERDTLEKENSTIPKFCPERANGLEECTVVMIILNPLPDQSVWRLKGRYWMTHL